VPLVFDNRLSQTLPADPSLERAPRAVREAFSWVQPTPVSAPKLLAYSQSVAEFLGLSASELASAEFAEVFAGNQLYPGMQPVAINYGGHQFGRWAGQLGDGRAISLGETVADGRRWELQLKGAGPTPYSRHADGRAVLRSSLREFICSEAMQHLGVPTTRALSLISTGEPVARDMFYDGNRRDEPGAIVCRVAPSFIRFGNFELPSARGDHALLAQWVDFCIARDFPHVQGANARADWFMEVCTRTATMIAHWLRVGFVHGVMNTDNMSILGLTIDYGPYGWLEDFDPGWTPNTTDAEGKRYCFGRQPEMGHWNLGCLAQALAPLFADQAPLHEGLRRYGAHFNQQHSAMNAAKLGLAQWRSEDVSLLSDLFALMQAAEMDMSLTFQGLTELAELATAHVPNTLAAFEPAFYRPELRDKHALELRQWLARYQQRVSDDLSGGGEASARVEIMRRANPIYVPRNYLAQQAIDSAESGDCGELQALIDALSQPYTARAHCARFAQKRPEWARVRAGCSMLSCSS
jgi:serine/tyrosine/threonine adenylyltransferase